MGWGGMYIPPNSRTGSRRYPDDNGRASETGSEGGKPVLTEQVEPDVSIKQDRHDYAAGPEKHFKNQQDRHDYYSTGSPQHFRNRASSMKHKKEE